jgi:RES domain-containing protein
LYRIAKKEYANLSGAGSALYPGRWNRPGQEAIYTSTDVATPVLERLVHTPKGTIPTNLAIMTIALDIEPKVQVAASGERSAKPVLLFASSIASARAGFEKRWAELDSFLAVAVPSVIVPAWNVVLYPEHPLFWHHVSLVSVEEFQFDPRLFPDTAVLGKKQEAR